MDLYDVMRTTFAARDFTGEPVPDDVLLRILDNARFAPSGGNRQGAHITVVRDRAVREELKELSMYAGRRYAAQSKAGEGPWNPLYPPGPSAEEIATTRVPSMLTEPMVTCDVLLVVSVDLERVAAIDQELERVSVAPGASIYPLVWNILLGARNEGFGGTLTTMATAREPEIQKLLGIPATHAVAALLPLGKPVKQLTRLRRRPVEDFVTLERYDGAPFTG
ncbi:nitroreductase family protein [Cumulibacter manganitolerans]|uniref:nitroreductase family protein n=1 Tax=Cumulibacter manganitolerans TaxID=1884992 RepID=UPI0012976EC0|nr:nitroreductase family protein [Cumulibacter manganitolerans]